MAKRPTKNDFAKVRAVLQRSDKKGMSFDHAVKQAAAEEPDAMKRIVGSPDA